MVTITSVQQVTENVIFIFFNFLLSSLVVACLKHLDEGGLFQPSTASNPDLQTTQVKTILSGFPDHRWQPCLKGYFRLRGMHHCRPLLDCDDIQNEVRLYNNIVLDESPARLVRLAKWNHKLIAHNVENLAADQSQVFDRELNWLKSLEPSAHVVQLIGYCEDQKKGKVFLSEYHRHGNALGLNQLLIKNGSISRFETAERLRFCVSFAELLANLHKSQLVLQGEDHEPETLLTRMVIADGPWRLVLSSFDSVRTCANENDTMQDPLTLGSVQSTRDDISSKETDIFIAPRICNQFLKGQDDKFIKNQLQDIHRRCRDPVPLKRPTATALIQSYKEVLKKLELQTLHKKV